MTYTITQLNQMPPAAFVEAIGAAFEDTPAIASTVWQQRPFTDVADLHQKMVNVVTAMSQAEKLALIRAHPDLGSKLKMADASVQEQAGAGLNQLTPPEYARLQFLNQAYQQKFGFPFIVAVKNHTKDSILATFERRMQNSLTIEIEQALTEIAQIAKFRLFNWVQ